MDLVLYSLLPMIVALGLITSYQDTKFGKIKNRFLVIALVYAAIAYSLVITYLIFSGFDIRLSYLFDLGINSALALGFSFVAWNFGFWSAADGKLFFTYSVLVPLSVYSNTYFTYFPSFVILINTFVPAFLIMVFLIFKKTDRKQKIKTIKEIDFKYVPFFLINLFWITWIVRIISTLGFNLGPLGGVFIVLSIMFILFRYAGKYRIRVGIIMSVVRLFLDISFILSATFLFEIVFFSSITVGMYMFMIFIMHFSIEHKAVPIKSLKRGMLLGEIIFMKENKFRKAPLYKALHIPRNIRALDNTGEGLSNEQIKKLISLHKKNKLDFSEIKIKRTWPFAPFMFLGVILTIVFHGFFLVFLVI